MKRRLIARLPTVVICIGVTDVAGPVAVSVVLAWVGVVRAVVAVVAVVVRVTVTLAGIVHQRAVVLWRAASQQDRQTFLERRLQHNKTFPLTKV